MYNPGEKNGEEGRDVRIPRSARRSAALFIGAALFCMVGHIVLFHVSFFECFPQFFCGAMLVIWAMSVQKRVTDPRLRQLLLWSAVALLVFLLLQIGEYNLFSINDDLKRLLWYGYYLPIMAAALLCFYLAICIHRPPEERLSPLWILPGAACAVMMAGIMTNDLHRWAFDAPGAITPDEHTFGPLFFAYFLLFSAFMLAAFLVTLGKRRRAPGRKLWFLPVLPILFLTAYLILNIWGRIPRVRGITICNIGDTFCFCMVGYLEALIQTGLIPANREYESLFRLASLPAVILDREGAPVIRTAGAEFPFPEDNDRKVWSHPITGGSIRWMVDTRHLRELNAELEETNRRLEARGAYLAAENKTEQEKTRLETRNRLYDGITDLVRPQLDQIGRLVRKEDFEKQLPRIAVLSAYVKRRSNMELLAADRDIPLEELALAVRESMEYVKLCGVRTAVTASGTGSFSSGLLTEAYETLEWVLEECLDGLTDVLAAIKAEGDTLTVRLLLNGTGLPRDTGDLPLRRGSASLDRDGKDAVLTITFREGRGETP